MKRIDISRGLKDTKFTYNGLVFVFDAPWTFVDIKFDKFSGIIVYPTFPDGCFITHTNMVNLFYRGQGDSKNWLKSIELSFKDLFSSLKHELSCRKKELKSFENDIKLIG
jgi:hypothetical protein